MGADRPFHDLGQCVRNAVAPRRRVRTWHPTAPGWPVRWHLIRKAR